MFDETEVLIPDKLGLWQEEKETGSILWQWHQHVYLLMLHIPERSQSILRPHRPHLLAPTRSPCHVLLQVLTPLQAILVESPCMLDIIEKVAESSRGVVNWAAVCTQAGHDPSAPPMKWHSDVSKSPPFAAI